MIDRDRLLKMRAEIDAMLAEMDDSTTANGQQPAARFMTVPAFAEKMGFSDRTIRDYCELGMPHRGEGRGRRVLVAEAERWLDEGGPRKARAERKGHAA